MKKALVTGGTKNDINAMAVLALNAKDKCPKLFDELVIFHDGISDKEQKIINEIVPTRFIRYKSPISKLSYLSNSSIRYFSPMVFCKIECFRLLEEYDSVVWSDYDVIIKEDISDLLNEPGYSFVTNKDVMLKSMFFDGYERLKLDGYDLNHASICTPIIVLHRDERTDYDAICDWYYSMLKKTVKYLYLPEQCLFTMMVQHWDMSYTALDNIKYSEHPTKDDGSARIIHAYGQPKFWNGLENDDWNAYYAEWMKIKENKNE